LSFCEDCPAGTFKSATNHRDTGACIVTRYAFDFLIF
jgi:hypothetical protein